MKPSWRQVFLVPTPPSWSVDWSSLDERFGWIRRLRDVPQDPMWHGEGDVWDHTRMVCESLASSFAWRSLSEIEREICWLAALLHDVAKPITTKVEGERVRSPHHAPKGAVAARRILWELGLPRGPRERVCGLIRHHLLPLHALDNENAERRMSATSLRCSLSNLALLAEADARGRKSKHSESHLDAIELFGEYARELGCWDRARSFPSDHTRYLFFNQGRPADVEAFDDTRSTVTLLSGFPGSGKTTWRKTYLAGIPAICLDEIREELGVSHQADQGLVRQEAKERARRLLRSESDFVWDATNLAYARRRSLIELFRSYGARVEVISVEISPDVLHERNSKREHPPPHSVMHAMFDRWEVADITEAHGVTHVSGDEKGSK